MKPRVHTMDEISDLVKRVDSLSINDACFILQFIQDRTAPLLSLRTHIIPGTSRPQNRQQIAHKNSGNAQWKSVQQSRSLQQSSTVAVAESRTNPPSNLGETCISNGQRSKVRYDLTNLDQFPPISTSSRDSFQR